MHATTQLHKPAFTSRSASRPARWATQTSAAARSSSGVTRSSASPAAETAPPLQFKHVLLAVLDKQTFLTEGSKAAVAMAAEISLKATAKITVLVVEDPDTSNEPQKQLETVGWHLRDRGCSTYELLHRVVTEPGPAGVLISEAADELGVDLVVLSSAAVHAKHINMNLLADVLDVPLLLVPY
eukprot:CAMPEP_0119108442 /NCGR_PEP_ID=MMETSP1180-20130426/14419_1 /TAXON_ID=3052 ORGANISM="Chlamydomonas cf sp, Strain CCMP681" /NCGR_SAMPLE_ID=MMETSP1180 /ASSEMBLY_ACC=CAM_ASM_000741 /LENGTH=182 /DNA_ID=CAMNT_0007094053 /DNA_START=77 /DNA_END=625 /DNA_ORIENTATION=-